MALLLLPLTAAAICQVAAPAGPRLAFDADFYDFGRLAPGTRVTHRFLATNTGQGTLVIQQVQPSCGCTTTVVGKTRLAPGESTAIEATYNAAGLSSPVRKTIQVRCNDPLSPIRLLTFAADSDQPAIIPSTTTVFFADTQRQVPRKASVKLTSTTGHPIDVTDMVMSDAPWLGVATRPDGLDLWVDFKLVGRHVPRGVRSGTDTVAVHAANPAASVINLTVRWSLR